MTHRLRDSHYYHRRSSEAASSSDELQRQQQQFIIQRQRQFDETAAVASSSSSSLPNVLLDQMRASINSVQISRQVVEAEKREKLTTRNTLRDTTASTSSAHATTTSSNAGAEATTTLPIEIHAKIDAAIELVRVAKQTTRHHHHRQQQQQRETLRKNKNKASLCDATTTTSCNDDVIGHRGGGRVGGLRVGSRSSSTKRVRFHPNLERVHHVSRWQQQQVPYQRTSDHMSSTTKIGEYPSC